MKRIYIGYIECGQNIERKIREKHSVTLSEVREAVQNGAADTIAEGTDNKGTTRFIARGTTYTGRSLFVVLYPTEPISDTFFLGTAFSDNG